MLAITTECAFGRSWRRGLYIGVVFLFAVVTTFLLWVIAKHIQLGRPIKPEIPRLSVIALSALFLVTIPRWMPWGTWEFDEQAIRFVSREGKKLELLWSDVERVTWDQSRAGVKGVDTKIWFPWQAFELAERSKVRAFMESKLSPRFDLTRKRTSSIVWVTYGVIALEYLAWKLELFPWNLFAALAIVSAGLGCYLKLRASPTWRRPRTEMY